MRQSIKPTYDSREVGPQYWVTTEIGDRTVHFRTPLNDPFVRQAVFLSFWDVLRALFRSKERAVYVTVGGKMERIYDVLELDGNTLIRDSTRRAAYNSHLNERLGNLEGSGVQ